MLSKTGKSVSVTAIILTFNEERHIERCVVGLARFVDHVIVVDSYSTDDTVVISKRCGARVVQNEWTNHAGQFNWALDTLEIKSDWVLRCDADEYLEGDPFAFRELLFRASPETSAFTLKRKYFFLGKWMRFGGMYPIHTLRLFRTGLGRVEDRLMDEHIVVSVGSVEESKFCIVDDNLNDVGWWIDKHNAYATKEMLEMLDLQYHFLRVDSTDKEAVNSHGVARLKRWLKEHIYAAMPLFSRPIIYFLYRYFIRLGFLDGRRGFAFHFMQGLWYRSLVDLKLLEAKRRLKSLEQGDKDALRDQMIEFTGVKL